MNSKILKPKTEGGINSKSQYQAQKLKNLQSALIEGEQSGDAGELDIQVIKDKARAGI